MLGWSKTLASEVARDGVTVNVVMPGRIHTTRMDELDAAAAKRTGKPVEEVASERASYVTGPKIRIDGGAIRSV